jgi:hypothetical protein
MKDAQRYRSHDAYRLHCRLDHLERHFPTWMRRLFRRLRRPSARWVRIPVGVMLILGGVASFLPVLGVWMLPLGLLLIAQDLPFLHRPARWLLVVGERRWRLWRRRRRH